MSKFVFKFPFPTDNLVDLVLAKIVILFVVFKLIHFAHDKMCVLAGNS